MYRHTLYPPCESPNITFGPPFISSSSSLSPSPAAMASSSSWFSPLQSPNNATGPSRTTQAGTALVGLASLMSLWFGSNDVFSAGFGLIFLNSIWNFLKSAWLWIWNEATSRMSYSVTIKATDEMHEWLLEWLATQSSMSNAHTAIIKTAYDDKQYALFNDDKPTVHWLPSEGQHMIQYRGKYVVFNTLKEKPSLSNGDNGSLTISSSESLQVTLYHNDRRVLNDLLNEAMDLSFEKGKNKTRIYSCKDLWNPWRSVIEKEKRELASVVLDKEVCDQLMSDLLRFIDNKEWYVRRGIPYRRGYLLYGPPGTGKTSCILAMAGKIGYNICTLNANGEFLTDAKLLELLQKIPKKSIVILEDVDAVFVKRKDVGKGKVTFSGLLNALDGVASADGRILFMTTNHLERLSPALIRPGRVDRKFLFDFASLLQIRTMFEQFYGQGDVEKRVLDVILEKVGDKKVTTAQLQGWFILYCDKVEALVDTVDTFVVEAANDNNRKDDVEEEDVKSD